MKYEYFVATRYLTAKRKQAFISVITLISILGISIGVMSLIIAIALITGFQGDVQDKVLGTTSHLLVADVGGEGIKDHERLLLAIEGVEGIRSVTPVVQGMVLVSGRFTAKPAQLRGLDLEAAKQSLPWLKELLRGDIPSPDSKRDGVILGRDLAYNIGANVGDVVTVMSPSFRLTPLGPAPKLKKLRMTGIFFTGLYEFDSGVGLVTTEAAQRIFGLEGQVSTVNIMLDRFWEAPRIKNALREVMPDDVYMVTWMEMNETLFSALKLEKQLMFFTITLIVIVAALNIIATLILMVMEKTRDIGILIAMGATRLNILNIFFLQGAMIGVIGTLAGTVLGLTWCWLANTFEIIKIPAEIYHIAFVPFRIHVQDLLAIIGITLLISLLSTLFPSFRASKVDPVIALKYE